MRQDAVLNDEDMIRCIRQILEYIDGNPNREGLIETPVRVLKSWNQLYSGYSQDPQDILKTFEEGACDEMIILRNIEFYSTCEHHLLPFFGKIHIGYIPNGKVLGVSKIARVVEIFSRRLQIQEKMTTAIADTLVNGIQPLGVIVICEAQHLCMMARGIQKQNSVMITSAVRGVFRDKIEAREEFLKLIRG